MSGIVGLAEVVLFVSDMNKSLGFYRGVLGLQVFSPPELPGKFLRIGSHGTGVPHQIVLVPRPEGVTAAGDAKYQRDLHHIGLEVAPEDFETEKVRIRGFGLEVREGEHPFLPVQAFYIDDPDGNEVEIVARYDLR